MCIPFLCQNSTLITFDCRSKSVLQYYPKCCLDQVSYHVFNKKNRGTDIFGLCFVNMTLRVLSCWKNYIQMPNLRMFTLYMAEKYAYAWFNLISCRSVQKEIINKVEKYSQRLSCCVIINCLVASGSKAAGLRQFSKVRSSKRDFVDRCKFHCCCTLLQLCMLPCRNLSFYAKM